MPVVFVSGASRGVGLALGSAFAGDGWTVFGNGRSEAPDEAVPGLTYIRADNRTIDRDFPARHGIEALDALVLAAAVFGPADKPGAAEVKLDRLSAVIDINALDQLRVLQAFLPCLSRAPAPRVAMLISKGGIARNMRAHGSIYYRTSKATQLAMGLNLAPSLEAAGVVFRLVNPGSVRTRIGGRNARFSAEESAAAVKGILLAARLGDPEIVLDFDGAPLRP